MDKLTTTREKASFVYAIALLYAITDLDTIVNSTGSIPLAEAYRQGTSSKGGAFGLLLIVLLAAICGTQGSYITVILPARSYQLQY